MLTDDVRPDEAMTRLRSRFPHVLVLEWRPEGVAADERSYGARVRQRDDLAVVEEFVRHVRGAGDGRVRRARRARPARRGPRGRPARGGVGMRPHRLRLQAFGPFPTCVEVDLDALAASGIFLLHGETGAGKTTLLDGLGFALYGRVPGVRGKTARLRADAADPAVRTEVELEVTLGGRRWRIVRRPAQERPKARGTGTTTEQASVRLDEWRDGGWASVSTRIDEAAAELDPLLGMSADQFFQVVLLPQGEFAQFLRADNDDRRKLLQRLFATERFRAVEDWLADRRVRTAAALAAGQQEVRLRAARLAQAAGVEEPDPLPDGWALDLLVAARPRAVAGGRAARPPLRRRPASRAAAALEDAQRLAGRQARRREAAARRDRLAAGQGGARGAAGPSSRAAARAAELAPLLERATATARRPAGGPRPGGRPPGRRSPRSACPSTPTRRALRADAEAASRRDRPARGAARRWPTSSPTSGSRRRPSSSAPTGPARPLAALHRAARRAARPRRGGRAAALLAAEQARDALPDATARVVAALAAALADARALAEAEQARGGAARGAPVGPRGAAGAARQGAGAAQLPLRHHARRAGARSCRTARRAGSAARSSTPTRTRAPARARPARTRSARGWRARPPRAGSPTSPPGSRPSRRRRRSCARRLAAAGHAGR